MKTIAITVDEDIICRLERLTKSTAGPNRSSIVREAIREYLNRLERADEERHETEILKQHGPRLARQARALVKEQAKP